MRHHKLGKRSKSNLKKVHPKLITLVSLALQYSKYDFGITQGQRTLEEQKVLVAKKLSWTMNSKHLLQKDGYVHAVDIMVYDENGKGTWDTGYYRKVIQAFVRAAIELGIQVEFGGLWKTTVDAPHVQLVSEYLI